MTDTPPPVWDVFVRELSRWTESTGHSYVPNNVTVPTPDRGDFPLGKHLAMFRHRHAVGKMPRERARTLERLRGWQWDAPAHRAPYLWDRDMTELRDYYESKRSLRSLDADKPALARWLRRQTAELDQLTKAQRRQLEQVPGALHRAGRLYEKTQAFVDATTRWLKSGHELAQLRDRTKVELDDQVVNIGRIAARRRAQHEAGELDEDTIALIESIPGWYWATPDDTEDGDGDAAAAPPTRE